VKNGLSDERLRKRRISVEGVVADTAILDLLIVYGDLHRAIMFMQCASQAKNVHEKKLANEVRVVEDSQFFVPSPVNSG